MLCELFDLNTGNRGSDKERGTDRRRQQANAEVQHHHDAKMDRGQAEGHPDRKNDRGKHQDQACHFNQASKDEHQTIQHQQDEELVVGNRQQAAGNHFRHLEIGKQIGKGAGHADQNQNLTQHGGNVVENARDVLPAETAINKQTDNQRPDDSAGGGFRRRKDTGNNADNHKQNGKHTPD